MNDIDELFLLLLIRP